MKTDIKSLLEFAGVDVTKGKARRLVEAAGTEYHILEMHSDEDIYYESPSAKTTKHAEAFLKDSKTEKADISDYDDDFTGDEDGKKFSAAMKENSGGQLYDWFGWVNEDGEPLFGENPEEEEEDPGMPFVGNEMTALIYKTGQMNEGKDPALEKNKNYLDGYRKGAKDAKRDGAKKKDASAHSYSSANEKWIKGFEDGFNDMWRVK